MKKHRWVLLFLFPISLYAANLSIPHMELITHGQMTDNSFGLTAYGNIDVLFEGGYKFGGRLQMNIESTDLLQILTPEEKWNQVAAYIESQKEGYTGDPVEPPIENFFAFQSANIILREMFSLPLDFTFFVGDMDSFCSGDDFAEYFGSAQVSSLFRGFKYYPDPNLPRYEGIHTPRGIGIKLDTTLGTDWFRGGFYLYQDDYLGLGRFSTDLRVLFNTQSVKAEFFIGASYPGPTIDTAAIGQTSFKDPDTAQDPAFGFYRTGLLLYYTPGPVGEFLTQVGIPKWDPVNDGFSIDLFYFLFEPRINLGFFSLRPTFFWHPSFYKQKFTDQIGNMSINTNFYFGDPEKFPLSGGIEATFDIGSYEDGSFSALAAPYMSLLAAGVVWDFKINFNLYPLDLTDMVEAFIGITAEF